MSENWRQCEMCAFSCDGLFHYKFIAQFANERIFLIGEHLAKFRAKWLSVTYAKFTLDFCRKDAELAR